MYRPIINKTEKKKTKKGINNVHIHFRITEREGEHKLTPHTQTHKRIQIHIEMKTTVNWMNGTSLKEKLFIHFLSLYTLCLLRRCAWEAKHETAFKIKQKKGSEIKTTHEESQERKKMAKASAFVPYIFHPSDSFSSTLSTRADQVERDGTPNLQHYNLHQQPKQIENYVRRMFKASFPHCTYLALTFIR